MSTNKPFYLAGTQGEGTRIWVAPVPCSLIAPQSGTFTVAWPTKLGGRSTVNNSSEDDETELENFDNDGWRDYAKTSLGQTITTTGMFMNLDAGYMNVKKARLQYQVGAPGKVFLKVAYPTPTCPGDTAYTSGFIYSGIANITSDPIESSSKGIIMGNIDFKYCGIVTVTFNGSPLVVTV
nr:MAG: hypothetical protein [uncultured cyanophage]WFD61473.1 MAG: hypothetical protein [uncultured cyanophage]